MTPRGNSSELKDALFARFPHVRAAFNQTAFIESLNLSHQVLADIWLPVGFPPISFEDLSEEEEKVAQSGQFANINNRARSSNPGAPGGNSPNYSQTTSTGSGEYRNNNPRGGPRQPQRSRGGGFANPRSTRQEFSSGYTHHHHEDETIEDPDSLWATPTNDTFGTTDFGSFDANGMFRAAVVGDSSSGGTSLLECGLEDSSASSAAFEGFMQTRHHHVTHVVPPPQPAPVPVYVPAPVPAVAIPHITPDTQWLYRDPSGQIQGPFPSHRMIEWYNGKYFPEHLPLRREQDAFFEPLSTWKTKCAGQVPFIAYTPEAKIEKPLSFGSIHRTEIASAATNSSASQWFNEPEQPAAIKTAPKVVAAAISATHVAPSTQTTRSVPIESLFNRPVAEIEKPTSPEVMMPTWKKLDKPSVATKFGQMTLESEIAVVESVIVSTHQAPVSESPKPAAPLAAASVAAPAPLSATSSWSNSPAASTGSLKKISLSEIMKSGEEPNIILEKERPAPVPVTAASLNGAGWAKLSASPVQSLSSIQAEEAARRLAASASSSSAASVAASAAPSSKSFADLVRSAGVIQGNIVISPVVISGEQARPLTERKPSLSGPTGSNTNTNTFSSSSNSSTVSHSKPATVPAPSTAAQSPAQSLEDWCVSSLKPLSKSIDPQTCTILLMDLPSPSALLTFALETLKPLDAANNFDLAAFAQEFSKKQFGAKATEKVQWTKLKSAPQIKKQEESFETVKRKK